MLCGAVLALCESQLVHNIGVYNSDWVYQVLWV